MATQAAPAAHDGLVKNGETRPKDDSPLKNGDTSMTTPAPADEMSGSTASPTDDVLAMKSSSTEATTLPPADAVGKTGELPSAEDRRATPLEEPKSPISPSRKRRDDETDSLHVVTDWQSEDARCAKSALGDADTDSLTGQTDSSTGKVARSSTSIKDFLGFGGAKEVKEGQHNSKLVSAIVDPVKQNEHYDPEDRPAAARLSQIHTSRASVVAMERATSLSSRGSAIINGNRSSNINGFGSEERQCSKGSGVPPKRRPSYKQGVA